MISEKLKKCSIIYTPKGQAFEYSELATNPYRGCGHKCAYCYVPNAIRMNRKEFNSIAAERKNFESLLIRDAKKYKEAQAKEQIMLSFTTDPYHPFDTSLTKKTINTLINYSLSFCVLTKGGSRSLRDISLYRAKKDCFATTLTSLSDSFSKKWELGAALPNDRINTLKKFSEKGIFTWVSLEPTIDVNASIDIIKKTHSFVDLFKIGRANYLPMTKTTDWEKYTHEMINICHKLNIKHYIKKDLQKYLPEKYYNPLRIKQHF
jgi:DNA repair photolyase